MVSQLEIVRSIFGAWRLLTLDAGGMQYFNRTPEGAINSFTAALVVLPGSMMMSALPTVNQTGVSSVWLNSIPCA